MVSAAPSTLRPVPSVSTLRARSPHPPLVRTSSSASIGGDATYAAAPPPLPPADKRSLASSSSPRSPPAPKPNFPRRRPRLLAFLVLVALVLFLLLRLLFTPTISLLYLARFKLSDRAHTERWSSPFLVPFGLRSTPCALRKEPLVFVRGEGRAALVWETNGCGADRAWSARLGTARRVDSGQRTAFGGGGMGGQWEWRVVDVERAVLVPETATQGARVLHTARLDGLRGGELYQYELVLAAGPGGRSLSAIRHSFPWLGAEVDAARPTTLHVACVADNQYNLRVFRRVLLRLLSLANSLPSSRYFSLASLPRGFSAPATRALSPLRRPHLLLHGGDAVQNPGNLAQWQTDLWDVLTRGLSARWKMGQKTPVLLARGNHDWDPSGANAYTGGPWNGQGRGTYHAFSPHARMRILVLDSNLPTVEEQTAQERWLEGELARDEWRAASLRVAVVHTAPWIEWWDREAWTRGGESQWSAYVRTSLLPILARAECSFVLSGHSHAYTRGFLPYALVPAYASAANSSALPPFAAAAARERGWERTAEVRSTGAVTESGMVLVTLGGAGGTLDGDRVEEWGFMSVSLSGTHHGGWLALSFAGRSGVEPPPVAELDAALGEGRSGKGVRVFDAAGARRCSVDEGEVETRDVLEWRAVGVNGEALDRVFIVSRACVPAV